MKNIIVLIMASGLMILLLVIVIGDFYVALEEKRPVDESVIQLLQMSVTGIIGLVAGFISSKPPKV
jgi:hypothetical protein|tara:strand:- start:1063 stop:1260 length:198 start_codon:yes stop_codon:yes gene_type:complete